jgi:trehalose synthase
MGLSMIQKIDIKNTNQLREYKNYAYLSGMVDDLYSNARSIVKKLRGRTVWMINSTATGGGVAEMMPKMVSILRQLKVNTEWLYLALKTKSFSD